MKRIPILIVAALISAGCSSKGSPTGSNSDSVNVGSGVVRAVISAQAGTAEGGVVNIVGPSGPVTNAAVTLSSTDIGSVPVTYVNNDNDFVLVGSGNSVAVTSGTYSPATGPWTYTVGRVYTLTAKFGGTTYSSSVTATDSPTLTTGTTILVATWAQAGNCSIIQCVDESNASDYKDYGPVGPLSLSNIPGLSSPATVVNSQLPGFTGSNYLINAQNNNINFNFTPSGLNSPNSCLEWSSATVDSGY